MAAMKAQLKQECLYHELKMDWTMTASPMRKMKSEKKKWMPMSMDGKRKPMPSSKKKALRKKRNPEREKMMMRWKMKGGRKKLATLAPPPPLAYSQYPCSQIVWRSLAR